ncbi:hypothetical protein IKE71_01105 [Candidatus Saccharibacteria bacterium]|nr:hypothetical protein [Candidatus Saccharibacteria bacterium]
MRQNSRTRLLIVLGAISLLSLGGTVAYFVTSETAHNVVSMSGVSILLNEFAGPEGSHPFHDLEDIVPGKTYSKIPYIENNGPEPVWIRAKVSLKQTANDGTESAVADFSRLMTLENIGPNWTLHSDGFYYYASPLSSGESSTPIFDSVKFADAIDGEFQLSTYTLTVSAEATQVKHNGSSALDAAWTESGV